MVEFVPRPLGDDHVNRAALVLGRPMVGMAAYDITRLIDCLAERPTIDPNRIALWTDGPMTLPALYALALDERIAGATLIGPLSTYVTLRPVPQPLWTVAPGLLRYADIDHLVALVAPRALTLSDPLGPDFAPSPPRASPPPTPPPAAPTAIPPPLLILSGQTPNPIIVPARK